jgi:hypothetical protein
MQPAANHFEYFPVEPIDELRSDLSFVGGFWGYKAQNFRKYLIPLCLPLGKYNIKIFGNQPWSVPQYMGAPVRGTDQCDILLRKDMPKCQ